jgi:ATP-dependent helicase Lhr and Lhr-like helicase
VTGSAGSATFPGSPRSTLPTSPTRCSSCSTRGILFSDQGAWSIGASGEAAFGRRHFIDLLSAFTSEPLFTVKHGQQELGRVHHASFAVRDDRPPVLLLAGHPWVVKHVDWNARVAYVEPTKEEGRSRWLGSGPALRFELCQAIARVLGTDPGGPFLSKRAADKLAEIRTEFTWLEPGKTALVTAHDGRQRWWTFGGLYANTALAHALREGHHHVARVDNFAITIEESLLGADVERLRELPQHAFSSPVDDRAITGLKFQECLSERVARAALEKRLTDAAAVVRVLGMPVVSQAL